MAGWKKGTLLSLLNAIRFVTAFAAAFLAGRHLGPRLGEIMHRPRIVVIPVVAGLTLVIVTFIFHIIMTRIHNNRRRRKQKEEGFRLPWYSGLCGGLINLGRGVFVLVLLFWFIDLLFAAMIGIPIPGADRSRFGSFSRRAVYETVNMFAVREGRESQKAAMARVISHPTEGMRHLRNVLAADSVQSLIVDRQFMEDFISGDARQIEANSSLQEVFNDHETLNELKELGVFSEGEKKSALCKKLSEFSRNETIRTSLRNLLEKERFSGDQIILLIRDPDFDVIVGELFQ